MTRNMPAVLFVLLASALPCVGQIQFVDITEQAELKQPLLGIMGHGGAWGDVDGDGHLDLFVGGFADRPDKEYLPAKGPVANVLLRNLGDGRFEPWNQPAVQTFARTSGAVFADLDNDGDADLYVANNSKGKTRREEEPQRSAQTHSCQLFRNDGGKLVDVSKQSGACPASLLTARNIGVFDYNADGLLDLFVVEDRFTKSPRSVLLKNLGGLKFADVNEEAGIPDGVFGLGLAVADINEDGRPDFFVGHSNRFFLSAGRDRYREDESLTKTFAWTPLDGEDWPCGAAFGDLNRDGRLDLVLSIHHQRARNQVYINMGVKNGVPHFKNVTTAAGLPAQLENKSPHVELQDFDNDGWLDIYLSTAWMNTEGVVVPLVYRNAGAKDGVPQFIPASKGHSGKDVVYYPAGPSADFDGDGRMDLFLINWFRGNHCRLLENTSEGGHWLQVKVLGKSCNRDGIGSQIKIYPAGKSGDVDSLLGFQELTTGYGYASGQPAACHLGLGEAENVDLVIRLPNGKVVKQQNVATDRVITIEE